MLITISQSFVGNNLFFENIKSLTIMCNVIMSQRIIVIDVVLYGTDCAIDNFNVIRGNRLVLKHR